MFISAILFLIVIEQENSNKYFFADFLFPSLILNYFLQPSMNN